MKKHRYTDTDVRNICDFIDDLCEVAHRNGENVEALRNAQKNIWNWFAVKHCPNLMYSTTEELIKEAANG